MGQAVSKVLDFISEDVHCCGMRSNESTGMTPRFDRPQAQHHVYMPQNGKLQLAGNCLWDPTQQKWILVQYPTVPPVATSASHSRSLIGSPMNSGSGVAAAAAADTLSAVDVQEVPSGTERHVIVDFAAAAEKLTATLSNSTDAVSASGDSGRSQTHSYGPPTSFRELNSNASTVGPLLSRRVARSDMEDSTDFCEDGYSSGASSTGVPLGVERFRLNADTEVYKMTPRAPLPSFASKAARRARARSSSADVSTSTDLGASTASATPPAEVDLQGGRLEVEGIPVLE
mmetsp:Transcript_9643/g.21181  ORF Transcript_9643/g.21181 Transcript_9643/m.21181 type:complete len:287 (+) Transcript_9643:160-1020(+)|eukprot:CAMPEP_0206420654 /NCGR_PEP_ID=MMETSP0324_2-20121206/984_1 /ASSEMBLY_ACC=CAM_ASM_000836 /TAXON_ID=2866 /ORGANISM="Crypthecodinium cohnii, Strain Seligo" /LENGTH=286 /DNA_ID=CAMNT_0053884605 /DNA_START=79 /DNA_END=939 /DNA_ORIENTATION=-